MQERHAMTLRHAFWAALLLAVGSAWAGGNLSARQVLDKALSIHSGIKDYVCRGEITVDHPRIRISKRRFTVYVKMPNRVRIEAGNSIVVVPKEIFTLGSLRQSLRLKTKITFMGKRQVHGRLVYAIKVNSGDSARYKLWIWGDDFTFKRTEIWLHGKLRLAAEWQHERADGHLMPTKISFVFYTTNEEGKREKGTGELRLWGYRLNVGLPDSLFTKPSKKR